MKEKELDKKVDYTKDLAIHNLAKEHWNYIQQVIINSESNINPRLINVIGFHYITAFKHGYKHAKEEYEK